MRTHLVLGLAGLLPLLAPATSCASPSEVSAAVAPPKPAQPAQPEQPAQESIDELIVEGRRLLDLKKPKDAEGVFLQARELDGGSLRTHPLETSDVGWFGPSSLPEATAGAQWWGPMAFAAIEGTEAPATFDPVRDPIWRT